MKSFKSSPSANYRYFLYDPEGEGFMFFASAEDRDGAVKEVTDEYCPDGDWSPEVLNVFAGEVTHRATEVDRVDRPAEVDEDGNDEEGDYWPGDCEFKCRIELRPLDVESGVPRA